MPSLTTLGQRFETDFITVGGGAFKGTITALSEREPPSYSFLEPRRILSVRMNQEVQAGQVVVSAHGQYFLLGRHGTDEAGGRPIVTAFRLFEITDQLTWETQQRMPDPVTGLDGHLEWVPAGNLWVVKEPEDTFMDREFRMPDLRHRILTGSPVKTDDRIGGHTVKKVQEVLGIYQLEVS